MTDLVRDVAARTRPPEFEALVRRAGRRRSRRRAAGVAGACTLVVGVAIAAGLVDPPRSHVQPTSPSPTPSHVPAAPEAIVTHGSVMDYAVDSAGALVSKWELCPSRQQGRVQCDSAFLLVSPDGSRSVWAATPGQRIFGGPGGLAMTIYGQGASILRDGGGLTPVRDVASGTLSATTVLSDRKGGLGLSALDLASETEWPVSGQCITGQDTWLSTSTISSAGSVWAEPVRRRGSAVALCQSTDGKTWHVAIPAMAPNGADFVGGPIATSGDKVAAVALHKTAWSPVAAFWTNVGGWHRLQGLPFTKIDSMAATTDGTLFVATRDGVLFRSTDWSTFEPVKDAPTARNLRSVGTSVTALHGGQNPRLIKVAADGTVSPWPQSLR